ncbi:MAG: GNAT family N-acetyltransferase [Cyanobacteria bacterium J06634_6]
MDRPRIPMSYEAFDTIEHLLGWKTEYWDGHAHLTPRSMGVGTCLNCESFTPIKETNRQTLTFITPTADYAEAMLDCYIAAFINSVEFCGWPTDRIFEEAQEDISLYFEGKRGKPLPAAVIALEPQTNRVIGTALITDKGEKGACLGLLYVHPSHHRKGIGTHIIARSVRILTQQGYSQLTSRYHICNHQSRQFYHKLGFQDVHDSYYLRIYTAWLGHKIYRREKLKMLDGIEALKRERIQLQEKLEVLEKEFLAEIRGVAEETDSDTKE